MSFTTAVNRVRMDFVAMPELEVSLPQAVRMWTLGMDDCRCVLDTLVDAGFLAWTPKRTVVRNYATSPTGHGRRWHDISVDSMQYSDTFV